MNPAYEHDFTLMQEAVRGLVEMHPELEGLPEPTILNEDDAVEDQILDMINTHVWMEATTRVIMEYTVEGEDKETLKSRAMASAMVVERCKALLPELGNPGRVLGEVVWATTMPVTDEAIKIFRAIWISMTMTWAGQLKARKKFVGR
jgi:hypothetical protein